MKRLFFLLLFALTALFFSACSSSDSGGNGPNGPAPQDISGTVIIPSAYNTGYIVQVCGDANNSNSCDSGETTVNVTAGSGEFSITTLTAYSLVAEFYDTSSTTSGRVISARNEVLPALVFTTPAGEKTISAFTTMVKNKVDTQPGIYNAISGAEKVKADTGITFDPFNAGSYSTNSVLHDKVSAVTAGILEYICDTLNINPDTFSAGVILALYDVVYDIVATVAANPDSADVNNLVDTNKGNVDNTTIADADGAVGEVWNVGSTISGLYLFEPHGNASTAAVSSGEDITTTPLPTDTLPPSGSFNLSDLTIKNANKAFPKSITTSERFSSKTFNLMDSAEVYTLIFIEDCSKNVQSAEYLLQNLDTIWGDNWDLFKGFEITDILTYGFDETFTLTTITDRVGDTISFSPSGDDVDDETGNPKSGTFVWNYRGNISPFNNTFPFTKHGSFVKTADEGEAFKLTTTDGSAAILFKHNEYSNWVLATYPILDNSFTFFNQSAAQDIIDQWKTDVAANY